LKKNIGQWKLQKTIVPKKMQMDIGNEHQTTHSINQAAKKKYVT